MGWRNPPMPWSELERRLSDGRSPNRPDHADGGDSPAWSRKRQPYRPPPPSRRGDAPVAYAELHCRSNFSFLDGASHPEELVEEADRLGLEALALTDHDGVYGVVRFAEAAEAVGVPAVFGVELTLGLARPAPQVGGRPKGRRPGPAGTMGHRQAAADPDGHHLVVLARDPEGYARLCRVVSEAHLAGGEKGQPVVSLATLAEAHGGHWMVLTGCRKGEVPTALAQAGPTAAGLALGRLTDAFGRHNLAVELWDHGDPLDTARNDALAHLALAHGVDLVATNNVHYATPARRALATALAAVRARRPLDEIAGGFRPPAGAHLRRGREEARRFARSPGGVGRAGVLGGEGAFDRRLVAPPDIDINIDSDRREEAIQHVYERYGRHNAAQVANVITYRARSAVRDMGKALGHASGQLDAWSKQIERWGPLEATAGAVGPDGRSAHDIPSPVIELAAQVENFPRHLGIHSGGMVICDRPVVEVCPVEWARMEGRSVLQWDKDDCAAVGLVKFDLLGLGMLNAIHRAIDLIRDHHGVEVDLAELPQEDAVFDMLCRADTVGVFQVESRAQMATLPRLNPRHFYDLVVEVALIRPGPIQGGSVHPYIRRRNGLEPATYLHPLLEPSLKKTLGVPLFQEQLMQMAIDVAGFTGAESDQLRQAMGSKRSGERMERLRARLSEGMAERGITGDVADAIYDKLAAFANFGFPESHSVSFAYLVYASAWIKHHFPAAFCAALLNAQPMGFWAPKTLVADARRHGVEVRRADVNLSSAQATLEEGAVRLGLEYVRTIGLEMAERIAAGRPYSSMEDLVRRTGV